MTLPRKRLCSNALRNARRWMALAILGLTLLPAAAQTQAPSTTVVQRASRGTGFFISADGLLITAAHVVRDHDLLRVVIDGRQVRATLLREDRARDLALLKVERSPVPYLNLGYSDNVPVGLEIYTIGYPQLSNPMRSHPRFSSGILSADTGLNESADYFQFSAPTESGNSGSPLLAGDLSVVGIVLSKLKVKDTDLTRGDIPQNVNFALKSTHVAALLQSAGALAPSFRSIDPRSDRKPFEVFQAAWRAVVPVLAANLPQGAVSAPDAAAGEIKP